jgi:organic hydroperoxide reductase OsmC/OhrA
LKITAQLQNKPGQNAVALTTGSRSHSISIAPKPVGQGSNTNGGELLFLALATCYCNDLYREATKRGITIDQVEVEVTGEFGAEGEPASDITYNAKVTSLASEDQIRDLMRHTDSMAEVHNTLRSGTQVRLQKIEVVTT